MPKLSLKIDKAVTGNPTVVFDLSMPPYEYEIVEHSGTLLAGDQSVDSDTSQLLANLKVDTLLAPDR